MRGATAAAATAVVLGLMVMGALGGSQPGETVAWAPVQADASGGREAERHPGESTQRIYLAAGGGTISLELATDLFQPASAGAPGSQTAAMTMDASSDFQVVAVNDSVKPLASSVGEFLGTELTLHGTAAAGDVILSRLKLAHYRVNAYEYALVDPITGDVVFELHGVEARLAQAKGEASFSIRAGLRLSDLMAERLAGKPVDQRPLCGFASVEIPMVLAEEAVYRQGQLSDASLPSPNVAGVFPTNGPDIIVGTLYNLSHPVSNFRVGPIGSGTVGLGVGTVSCNQGDEDVNWFSLPSTDHPVIPMNLYRLSTVDGADRFEQIGWSWMKHGFATLAGDECEDDFGAGACQGSGGSTLSVGCSDPYGPGLNYEQCGLGPRHLVNPFTGAMPSGGNLGSGGGCSTNYPARDHRAYTHDGVSARLRVEDVDLQDSTNPPGSRYFIEAQYISPHEYTWAVDNSQPLSSVFNNVSWREVDPTGPDGSGRYSFSNVTATMREQVALDAWPGTDSAVIEPAPGADGRAHLYSKVTDLGGGEWHYEYVLYNQNLDRAIQAFEVPISSDVTVTDIDFHAPTNHQPTGETFVLSNDAWTATRDATSLRWETETFAQNQAANAIRYGTAYNFRFRADAPPTTFALRGAATVVVETFKTPGSVLVSAPTPAGGVLDCNGNGVDDTQDIADGTSQDCDGNTIPDECQTFAETPLTSRLITCGFNPLSYATSPPGDTSRLFVTELVSGDIKVFDLDTETLIGTYLDLSSRISTGGERGLLSMAFHPDFFSGSPYIFVNYTNNSGDTHVARFTATGGDPNANTGNAASEVVLKVIDQDFSNHNGGQLQFGPDGMLYVGMGDGGSGGDPNNRSQDDSSLLGKMLRLDVDNGPTYIPADNPGLPHLPEVWSKGWRNPWRFSFDRLTGDLYVGDVGQGAHEEVSFEAADDAGGDNYGWRCYEGNFSYNLSGCGPSSNYVFPIIDIPHSDSGTCSITGGYVYRGCAMPHLSGTYFYADYCADYIRTFRYDPGTDTLSDQQDRTAEVGGMTSIVSFAQDEEGELYILTAGGCLYKIVPDLAVCGNGSTEGSEECDDGNTASGDGCSATCTVESSDDCAFAGPIADGTTAFSLAGATTDGPAHPSCEVSGDNGQTYDDIWFDYIASCTGELTVSTCVNGGSATYDSDLVVYNTCDCPVTGGDLADCNDDGAGCPGFSSTVVVGDDEAEVNAGHCYKIRVGKWNSSTTQGSGVLSIVCDGVPFVDCNNNGVHDPEDLTLGNSQDCNSNGIPDECDIESGTSLDCAGGPVGDPAVGEQIFTVDRNCFGCHLPDGTGDVGPNIRNKSRVTIWNKLLPPTDHPGGFADEDQQFFAHIEAWLSDTGGRGRPDLVPDECQTLDDCDDDTIADACELQDQTQVDVSPFNGIPDDCESCVTYTFGDVNRSGGGPNVDDILCTLDTLAGNVSAACAMAGLAEQEDATNIVGAGQSCGPDGFVNVDDLLAVLDAVGGEMICPDPCL